MRGVVRELVWYPRIGYHVSEQHGGLGDGRTVRKRHVTERRRRTIARERRAHRHVSRRRSLLGPLLLYETEGLTEDPN